MMANVVHINLITGRVALERQTVFKFTNNQSKAARKASNQSKPGKWSKACHYRGGKQSYLGNIRQWVELMLEIDNHTGIENSSGRCRWKWRHSDRVLTRFLN
jgi:hypothetical protein